MSKQRLTDKTSASSVSLNDIIHIVKTGDTTQNPLGSSYKATVLQFASLIGGGSIFTGGTISGPTTFTNGLTANTISTNTLTVNGVTITNIGNFITGGTYNNTTGVLSLLNTTGGTVNVTGFNTGGGGSTFTGGTVTGATNFTSGISTNTISATTYYNLPIDIRVTGGTYNSGSVTFTNNTGGTFTVTGFSTGGGGTFTGGTVSGPTIFVGGLSSTTISSTTLTTNTISATTATINTISATTATINTISATTATINTISATTATINTISATTATINTLSANTLTVNGVTITNIGNFITGGTYNSGTGVLSLLNTTGGTVNVTGFNTGGGGGTFTGGTVNGYTQFNNGLSATSMSATSLYINGTLFDGDTYTTGFTYTPTTNTFTIKQNLNKPDLSVTINTMSGLTVNGNITFTGQSNNPVYSAGSGTLSAGTSVITLNFNNSSIQTITLTGNTQFATPLNFKDGAIYTLIVKQNATGGNNVSWFTPSFKWENGTFPGITTTPNGVDLITFISDGTSLYGLSAKNFS